MADYDFDPDPGDVNDWMERGGKYSLEYKDEVVLKLIDALQDYLSFATTKDLLRLIVENT